MSGFNIFIDKLKYFFQTRKKVVLTLFIIFLFAFLLGLFCVIKSNNFSLNKIPDLALKLFLTKFNIFLFILIKIFIVLLSLFLLYLLTFIKPGRILILLIYFYFSICEGVTFGLVIKNFCFLPGLLLGIIYLIFETILNFILFFFLINNCNFNKYYSKCVSCSIKKERFKSLMLLLLLAIIIVILEAVLLFVIVKLLFVN